MPWAHSCFAFANLLAIARSCVSTDFVPKQDVNSPEYAFLYNRLEWSSKCCHYSVVYILTGFTFTRHDCSSSWLQPKRLIEANVPKLKSKKIQWKLMKTTTLQSSNTSEQYSFYHSLRLHIVSEVLCNAVKPTDIFWKSEVQVHFSHINLWHFYIVEGVTLKLWFIFMSQVISMIHFWRHFHTEVLFLERTPWLFNMFHS